MFNKGINDKNKKILTVVDYKKKYFSVKYII